MFRSIRAVSWAVIAYCIYAFVSDVRLLAIELFTPAIREGQLALPPVISLPSTLSSMHVRGAKEAAVCSSADMRVGARFHSSLLPHALNRVIDERLQQSERVSMYIPSFELNNGLLHTRLITFAAYRLESDLKRVNFCVDEVSTDIREERLVEHDVWRYPSDCGVWCMLWQGRRRFVETRKELVAPEVTHGQLSGLKQLHMGRISERIAAVADNVYIDSKTRFLVEFGE